MSETLSVLAPPDEAAVAAILRDATEPLRIEGAGTKQGMLRPVQAAASLSTRALTGITLYAPKELIISARAGTPLAEIVAALAAEGQHLIAEPPDLADLLDGGPDQTIGGVVATNLSGPRRVAWGATRDHVMGVRAVNGRGEIIRSGGRVLKNVTGLDLCKLLTGSHGALAVVTEITLKVLPRPERRATLMLAGLTPDRAVAAMSAALGSPYGVSAAAHLPARCAAAGVRGPATLVRLEDFADFVAYRSDRLRADLADYGTADVLDDATSTALWKAIGDAAPLAGAGPAIWRVSARPSRGAAVARAVADAFNARWFLDWGGGLVWIGGPATPAAHAAVVAAARAAGGVWTVVHGPAAFRAAIDVVPPEPAPLARITRDVKAAFDPRGILNPGRFYPGI